ncbi:MAG: hypothetical protein P8Q36_14310 [Alphaproteobacteria bacterium]|nr:hypothetical protein [Rhodospirillaceae bacterium]MBT6202757.1 hypothetical protein [Rhodospirillaceae bacterium]MBT6510123.1 hypothetical protein [Rhodospirillaceae bacterium]MBT7646117.1 hypothetical protein [Rhodospirillaceae bacterium]MDG2482019.1 hypothetical protein [Alphaproteobacteria bacterium]
MPIAATAFVICFLLIAVIAWAAVMAHGRMWRKVAALTALLALIPVGYVAIYELMGLPKPASTAFLNDFSRNHVVLAYDIHEDEAIFLWFEMPDGAEPRVFAFPYDSATVKRLQDASDEATAISSDLMARISDSDGTMRTRLEFTSELEFNRELPDKPDPEEDDVMFFEPETENTDSEDQTGLGYGQP